MRILLDTNILIRALLTAGGPAGRVLKTIIEDDEQTLVLSQYLLDEAAQVLARPRLRSRWPITDQAVLEFCDSLAGAGELIHLKRPYPEIASDPADNVILQVAQEGQADVLCTRDKHFDEPAVTEFARSNGFSICDDIELLRRLEAS